MSFKIQERLRVATVPTPKLDAPKTRPEMLRLIKSRVVADGVSPKAAAIARKTISEMRLMALNCGLPPRDGTEPSMGYRLG